MVCVLGNETTGQCGCMLWEEGLGHCKPASSFIPLGITLNSFSEMEDDMEKMIRMIGRLKIQRGIVSKSRNI